MSRGGRAAGWPGVPTLLVRGILLALFAGSVPAGNALKQDGCVLPSRWFGRWFQSGVIQAIAIDAERISNKGRCISSEGDKFLLVDEKGCYRCVVIHQKHKNVLQYKETFCHRRDALPHLCSLITGDALLYSMFREGADPVDCPLKGPFTFTYNRGHGDCKSPVSSIESCTEDSRLLLNYQACPDVYGSESAVEELECLATWKEGSLRFLVGKLHHNHATTNEDRYRCFVYEKTSSIAAGGEASDADAGVEYRVAQSGDATCNGLFSATEGSRTMALKRAVPRHACTFPSWLTSRRVWHTLDMTANYTFSQRNTTLRLADAKLTCVSVKASSPSGNSVALVTHWQHHCVSRWVCAAMYRRSGHVAEWQRGATAARPDDACSPPHFDAAAAPYLTLVASNPESKDCPYSGKYTIRNIDDNRNQRSATHKRKRRSKSADSVLGIELNNHNITQSNRSERLERYARSKRYAQSDDCSVVNYETMVIGCNSMKTMEFYSNCDNREVVTTYTCEGGWYEGGVSFVVGRVGGAGTRHCFVAREAPGALTLARHDATCERDPHAPALSFDAIALGECRDQTSGHAKLTPPLFCLAMAYLIHIIPR